MEESGGTVEAEDLGADVGGGEPQCTADGTDPAVPGGVVCPVVESQPKALFSAALVMLCFFKAM